MSRTLERKLAKLEGVGATGLGRLHIIYARGGLDYEAQRTALLADGRARATDTFMDWNCGVDSAQRDIRPPETIRITETHDKRVLR